MLKHFILKVPRDSQLTPEATQTFVSALTQINPTPPLGKLLGQKQKALALEIVLKNQQITFQVVCEEEFENFAKTQILSNYPLCVIENATDPAPADLKNILKVNLRYGNFYPIQTYSSFHEVDPLASFLSIMSKTTPQDIVIIQYALETVLSSWQAKGKAYAQKGTKNANGSYSARPDANIINEKINYPGFAISIRVVSNQNKTQKELASVYDIFSRPDGNGFKTSRPPILFEKKEIEAFRHRTVTDKQILNITELATLWHLPNEKVKVPLISWGVSVLSEPPENLPVAIALSDEEKESVNFFAKTMFKNEEATFGIKSHDRLRHIWTVGKTGTGKSTMIANMAIDDIKKGRGIAIIDPHGDLCDDILEYIPSNRINDTVYFNPADRDYPIAINPLEVTNKEEAELVVSGLMSIFTKVWANVWSARMEYILRNSFMTLAEIPGATLEDVLKILANQSFRNKVLAQVKDSALINFWKDEFEKMPENLQKEAIAPIQNKVGQFVTSPLMRRILSNPKSAISIDEIMNSGKIFLANLSQGRLGEDNSALLGATLITKFQVAAMRRVDTPKDLRRPFYLFVDEFQNFATESFIRILSEARKYGLALTLANQYMAQIPIHIQKAILGNAGTLITFTIGAEDANIVHREFAEVFTQNDLVNLQNYQIAIKMMVDAHSTRPFLAKTLPLPANRNQNRSKVITVSRERWGKKL